MKRLVAALTLFATTSALATTVDCRIRTDQQFDWENVVLNIDVKGEQAVITEMRGAMESIEYRGKANDQLISVVRVMDNGSDFIDLDRNRLGIKTQGFRDGNEVYNKIGICEITDQKV